MNCTTETETETTSTFKERDVIILYDCQLLKTCQRTVGFLVRAYTCDPHVGTGITVTNLHL